MNAVTVSREQFQTASRMEILNKSAKEKKELIQ